MVTLIVSYNTKVRAMTARDQMVTLVNQRGILFGHQQYVSPVPVNTPSLFTKVKHFFKRK